MAQDLANFIPALKYKKAQLKVRDLEGAGFLTTGNIFYLDSVNGNSANDGTRSDKAVVTLVAAVALCTASHGDVILIMPGHTESISSATALSLNIAGITVIGLSIGSLRPIFTLDTAATATINVTAANIAIENCVFVANFADVAAAFTTTTAKNFQLRNCEFRDTSSILNFVTLVDTNTTTNDTDGLTILDSTWFGLTATANSTVIKMDGTNTRLNVQRNYFAHAATTAAGFMIIATGKVVTNARISNNTFNLVGASNLTTGTLITTNGSTNSGVISSNFIFELDATSEILVTASSGFVFFDNKSSATADTSGYLLPAADS